jgi:hypothetical protein
VYALERFSVDDLVELSREVRALGDGADTMTEVAQRLVDKLFEAFRTASGDPALLSARLYKTHRFSDLPPDLKRIAADREEDIEDRQPCLVLLAAADDPAIATEAAANPNDRVQPLTERGLAEQPLMRHLLDGLGVEVASVLDPDRAAESRLHTRDLDVFHVPDLAVADGVDEQARERVQELGLSSMAVTGGVLLSGEMFMVVLFTRVQISDYVAQLMRSLGLAIKAALVPTTFRVWPLADSNS